MSTRFVQQWWTGSSHARLLESEHRLLSSLVKNPFRKPPSPHDDRNGSNVACPPYINWVEFTAPLQSEGLPTVLLAHGFGSGLGFFYRNIDDLLHSGKIRRVIGMDWLGMGGSTRVGCWESPIRSLMSHSTASKLSFCNSRFTTSDAVDFFLNPLDNLLRDDSLFQPGEEIWLVGHSLGGYLAARYAMRVNQLSKEKTATNPILTKVILASPVGFQHPPAPMSVSLGSNLPPVFRVVDALWSANFTPQALVRAMGSSRGRSTIKRALHGRIPHLLQSASSENISELDLLAEYLYHVTVAPASGEYAMNSLLEPAASEGGTGVYAREPLGRGIMAAVLGGAKTQQSSPLASVKVLYGDHDWMRFNESAAREECDNIKSKSKIAANVHIIPTAGHHLYIDNADSFVSHILDEC